jgi:esterase/lipase
MSTSTLRPIVLINGTWSYPESWDEMTAALEQRGYEVHAPPLRYHDLPVMEGARSVAAVSLKITQTTL